MSLKQGKKSGSDSFQKLSRNPRNPRTARTGSVFVGRSRIDIEDLVGWAYRAESAHKIPRGAAGVACSAVVRTNAQAVAQHAALGTKIDCGGSAAIHRHAASLESRVASAAAEDVNDAVCGLSATEAGLVVTHALADTRPDWMEGVVPCMVPWRDSRGRIEVYRDGRGQPFLCPVYCHNDPGMIAFARQIYGLWWDALACLATRLDGIEGRAIEGPAAPRTPWLATRCEAPGGEGGKKGIDGDGTV